MEVPLNFSDWTPHITSEQIKLWLRLGAICFILKRRKFSQSRLLNLRTMTHKHLSVHNSLLKAQGVRYPIGQLGWVTPNFERCDKPRSFV